MVKSKEKPQGIRIGRLSELTGISRDTIKFYLREGLIPRPVKTGRTMSYYDSSCVERIRLIKRLQDERFLPLKVIKGVLESKNTAMEELSLAEAFQGLSVFPDPVAEVSLKEIRLKTAYGDQDIERIEKAGLIGPRKNVSGKEYTNLDLKIISLIRQRERAGFSLAYSLEMMAIYRDAIAQIVELGTQKFAASADIDEDLEKMVQNIREGEQALINFMPLIRAKLAYKYLSKNNIEFQKIPERVSEIFHFRGLGKGRRNSSIQHPDEELLRYIDGFIENSQRKAIFSLIDGVRMLINGGQETALKVFEKFRAHQTLGSIAALLTGFAHLMCAAAAESYLQAIREFRMAASFLGMPPQPDPQSLINIIGKYLAATGLAVIPHSFDTHKRAAAIAFDLCRAVEAVSGRHSDKRLTKLLPELRAKTRMTIAAMHQYDEDLSQAAAILKDMKQDRMSPPFYRSWARQEMTHLAG